MFKGLIFLLLVVSTSAVATDYVAMVEQDGNALILSIGGERIASIDGYGLKSKEMQQKILNVALVQVESCITKGRWGSSVADEAKDKIGSVEFHINRLHEMTEGINIKRYVIVDSERMIREAYRHGYEDPYQFGVQVIKDCLINGF
jgi:hypothetical protein